MSQKARRQRRRSHRFFLIQAALPGYAAAVSTLESAEKQFLLASGWVHVVGSGWSHPDEGLVSFSRSSAIDRTRSWIISRQLFGLSTISD
jgi:hypothetical protein